MIKLEDLKEGDIVYLPCGYHRFSEITKPLKKENILLNMLPDADRKLIKEIIEERKED